MSEKNAQARCRHLSKEARSQSRLQAYEKDQQPVVQSTSLKILEYTCFLGYLYFTIYIFDNFYFYLITFLKKIMYFLLHIFSLTPKSTHYISNA